MDEAVRVALLALTYRECWRQGYRSYTEILDDFAEVPDELSLATVIGANMLAPFDWEMLNELSFRNGQSDEGDFLPLARAIAPSDPLRAEALLHACPPNGRKSTRAWAAPLVGRWEAVQNAMHALRDEGLVSSFGDVDLVARYASIAAGMPSDDYDDLCLEYEGLAESAGVEVG